MIDQTTAGAFGGNIRHLRGHHPLVLDDPTRMWIVLAGTADVVSSAIEDGIPVGTRRELWRVSEGDALFATRRAEGVTDIRLTVIPVEELELLDAPVDRIDTVCQAIGLPVQEAVEGWAFKVASYLSDAIAPASTRRIREGAELHLDAGEVARPDVSDVSWIRVESGSVQLLGRSELQLGESAFLPMVPDLWLTAEESVRIKSVPAASMRDQGEFLAGLTTIHSLLQQRLAKHEAESRAAELARLEDRAAHQSRRSREAIDEVHSVLKAQVAMKMRETPLLTAMSIVGDYMGIDIQPPPRSENLKRVKNQVEAIARASRIRHRTVLLRGVWWKSDSGPLLAFRKGQHQPVALLPRDGEGYDLVDPQTGERTRVSRTSATSLEPEATMVYRRLPDELVHPRRLVRFMLSGKSKDIFFVVVLASLATLLGMLTPLATAVVMDEAIPSADLRLLFELGLALMAAAFGAAIFRLSQGIVHVRMANSTEVIALAGVWDRLLKLRVSFFRKFASGDLLSRVSALSEVSRELNGATVQSLLAALMAVLNFGLLLLFSPRLAIIAAVLAVAVAVTTVSGGIVIQKHMQRLMELRARLFGLVVQMVNAVSKIRVAGAQDRAFATWCREYAGQLKAVYRVQLMDDLVAIFNLAVPLISTILLFWVGLGLVVEGNAASGGSALSIGVFLAFNTALATFLSGITALSTTAVSLFETAAKIRRTEPVLGAPQEVDDSKVDPGRLEGSVALSNVDFRYVAGGRKVLDNVCLRAEPGKFVAIVGPSGSGKSTIFRILLGFEAPESGTVDFDGQDLAGLDMHAVRRQLGVVLQAGRISSGSLLEHIGAGAQVTLEEAWEAIDDAGLGDDVRAMAMGLHTIISEGGTNLSGGQRQRLLIARALVTRPKILLMDEATSALDNATQAIVTESLRRRRVTRLVIAHRLSTICDADTIYVLDRGRVVEAGGYDELLGRNGLFSSMMARQTA